jgi:hypothetical protein
LKYGYVVVIITGNKTNDHGPIKDVQESEIGLCCNQRPVRLAFLLDPKCPRQCERLKIIRHVIFISLLRRDYISCFCPEMCTFYHGDIVGTVANGQGHSLFIFLDQFDNKGLLYGCHATTYHS